MGIFGQLSNWLGITKKEARILVIGLDNSGKSTILNHLKPSECKMTNVVPTVGFNIEHVSSKNLNLTAFDMSGQGRYRNLWENYYRETNGVIFVVDSSDRMRNVFNKSFRRTLNIFGHVPNENYLYDDNSGMVVAKDELEELLKNPDFQRRRVPILFFANKMDDRNAMSMIEVCNVLGLENIRSKKWHICASCALTGEGLNDGIEWLSTEVKLLLDGRK